MAAATDVSAVLARSARYHVHHGDALAFVSSLPDGCIDAVISDPPYPEIDRAYGRMTEAEWFALMQPLVRECRRVLAPHGSAVFILQPNSERVGRMRPWLWEFMAWACREWNVVQDVWWWNPATPPTVHTHRTRGLTRPSVKACVWLGEPDCWRDQGAVLWRQSDAMAAVDREDRALHYSTSGSHVRHGRMAATSDERGGSTPFNLIPMAGGSGPDSGGAKGHGAATPYALADWWTRYICKPGGIVLDPFGGSGTMGAAALRNGRRALLSEKHAPYWPIVQATMEEADRAPLTLPFEKPAKVEPTPPPQLALLP
jgi:DNA modification methylase